MNSVKEVETFEMLSNIAVIGKEELGGLGLLSVVV